MKVPVVTALLLAASIVAAGQQQVPADAKLRAQLTQLFPEAKAFSAKGGEPPHFKAYAADPSSAPAVNYAFWTTELEPLERGSTDRSRSSSGWIPKAS